MNREKMIEALAKAIEAELWENSDEGTFDHGANSQAIVHDMAKASAAAVLDLCGPKKLVWKVLGDSSVHDVDCRYEVAPDGKYWRLVNGVTGGGSYIGHFADRAAAQAAAQSHADAAHWANTVIGASQ